MANILNQKSKSKIVHVKAINEEAIIKYAIEEGFNPEDFLEVELDYLDDSDDASVTPEISAAIDILVAALGGVPVKAAPEADATPEVEAVPEPDATPEPEVVPEADATPEVEATPEPEAVSETETEPESEVSSEPEANLESDVAPEDAPRVDTDTAIVAEILAQAEPEFDNPALDEPPQHQKPIPTVRDRIRKIPYKFKIFAIILTELVLVFFMTDDIFMTVEAKNQLARQQVCAAEAAEAVTANVLPVIPKGTSSLEKSGKNKINEIWIETIRDAASNLQYVEQERDYDIENSETYKIVQGAYTWNGSVLSKSRGTITGPNGKETYYNLNMSVIMRMMAARGVSDTYWVRSDGCKMIGNYIMVAADLDLHPRGSIVKTSLGLAMVCDTGTFTKTNRNQIDIAVTW